MKQANSKVLSKPFVHIGKQKWDRHPKKLAMTARPTCTRTLLQTHLTPCEIYEMFHVEHCPAERDSSHKAQMCSTWNIPTRCGPP